MEGLYHCGSLSLAPILRQKSKLTAKIGPQILKFLNSSKANSKTCNLHNYEIMCEYYSNKTVAKNVVETNKNNRKLISLITH